MFPALKVKHSRFCITLFRMQDKKVKTLKEQVDAIGSVNWCDVILRSYHRFNSKARYINGHLFIPSNGEGISCIDLFFVDGSYVRFHMVSTFDGLHSFLDYVKRYFLNPYFVKEFSLEQSENGAISIVIDVSKQGKSL